MLAILLHRRHRRKQNTVNRGIYITYKKFGKFISLIKISQIICTIFFSNNQLTQVIVGAAVLGITMAYCGFGIWALVAQQVFNVFVDTCVKGQLFHNQMAVKFLPV